MPFIERKEATMINNALQKTSVMLELGQDQRVMSHTKQSVVIPIVTGSSGIGKTKIIAQVAKQSSFDLHLYLCFADNYGTPIIIDEIRTTTPPSIILGIRLFYTYFFQDHNAICFEAFMDVVQEEFKDLKIFKAMDVLLLIASYDVAYTSKILTTPPDEIKPKTNYTEQIFDGRDEIKPFAYPALVKSVLTTSNLDHMRTNIILHVDEINALMRCGQYLIDARFSGYYSQLSRQTSF